MSGVYDALEREALLAAKRIAHSCRHVVGASRTKQVIFIAGVQRSGTNMVSDVLERSFETEVFRESDPKSHSEFQLRSPEELHRLVQRSRALNVVFKALCESQAMARMLKDFAPAKAIWCVRHYADMTNSHLKKWSGCADKIGAIADGTCGADWRAAEMSPEMHDLVRKTYRADLNDASAVALFWYFRNMTFFEQGLDRDPRVRVIRYEQLVSRPQQEFERVFDFLGLAYRRRVSAKVHARSVRKNPPPSIDADIASLCDQMLGRFEACCE